MDMFWGLTCIPVSLLDRTGDILMQYPKILHGTQMKSVAATYMPMIGAGEMRIRKAYMCPAGSALYHAIIPVDKEKFICFGPVYFQYISSEKCREELSGEYSAEDICQLHHLAAKAARMSIEEFCNSLMLFMNYVVNYSCDTDDASYLNVFLMEGKSGQRRKKPETQMQSYIMDGKLLNIIREGDTAKCIEFIKDKTFFVSSESDLADLRNVCTEAVSCAAALLYSAIEGGLPQSVFKEVLLHEKTKICSFSRIDEFDSWLKTYICELCNQVTFALNKMQVPLELNECLKHIHANPCNKYSVEELADLIGISRSTLNRYFKKYLYTTPAKYIMEIKLKEAANILRTSDTSIAEIAYSLGFSSQSHFSKCFADKYQKTPLQYRKGYKE